MKIPLQKLTTNQQQILSEFADGLSAKMVAAKMGVSIHTVNNTKRLIYRKLDVNNITGALRNRKLAPVVEMKIYNTIEKVA